MADSKWPAGFSRWLFHHRKEDTPIGDLARDAYIDKKWPAKTNCFFCFHNYLHMSYMHGQACSECIDVFIAAWLQYSGVDFRRVLQSRVRIWGTECTNVSLADTGNGLYRRNGFAYIYVLHENFRVRYVGQAVDPVSRLRQHIFSPHGNLRLKMWINKFLSVGQYPQMSIIDEFPLAQIPLYEKAYVRAFEGHPVGGLGIFNKRLVCGKHFLI